MTCPICHKPSSPVFKPFCSKRCAEIDLGRWLNDSYKLPTRPDETGDEDEGWSGDKE
ncbi:DNA gyrase inhibitor YacG [Acidocella sp.]|uniref:DNA gyrase inhibitor YacG n=1 Tax=Acidocella sp. TaxID=50710 RepID=UPI003D056C9D